jgi:hypothetical protein
MMTRMERATATWGLALPRQRAIRQYRSQWKAWVRTVAKQTRHSKPCGGF